MKPILKYLFISAALAAIALSMIDFFIQANLRALKEDIYGKLNELFNSSKPNDIIFLGSSRIYHAADPQIIDSITGLSSYNFGLDGIGLIENFMMLTSYLEHHPAPTCVVLNLDLHSLEITDTTGMKNFTAFLPYSDHKTVRQAILSYQSFSDRLALIPFLRPAFNDDFRKNMALKHAFNAEGNSKHIFYKGFKSYDGEWAGAALPGKIEFSITAKGIALLDSIISVCNREKIKLLMVYAPQTQQFSERVANMETFQNYFDSVCVGQNQAFKNYCCDDMSRSASNFKSHLHLSAEGSRLYSIKLAHHLAVFLNREGRVEQSP